MKLKNLYDSNLDNLTLSQVCKCINPSSLFHIIKSSFQTITPEITYFDKIDVDMIKVINKINKLERLQCVIFDDYFTQSCLETKQQLGVDTLSVCLVVEYVFHKTIEKWKTIADIIESGKHY